MHDELTAVDIKKMEQEVEYRRLQLRPQLLEDVKTAREFGDLSENFEYKAAKREKSRNDSRIRYLERMIKTAKVIDASSNPDEIGLFDKVTIYIEEDDEERSARTRSRASSARNRPSARPSWATKKATALPSTSVRPTATTSSSATCRRARTMSRCPSAAIKMPLRCARPA